MWFLSSFSHAFHGIRATVVDDVNADRICVVEFADDVAVLSQWCRTDKDICLDLPSYRTAKGTKIVAHRWIPAQDSSGKWWARRALGSK